MQPKITDLRIREPWMGLEKETKVEGEERGFRNKALEKIKDKRRWPGPLYYYCPIFERKEREICVRLTE